MTAQEPDSLPASGRAESTAATPPAAIVRQTRVRPGHEEEYVAWRARVIAALHGQPGLLRVEVHPPDHAQSDWITVERFASLSQAQQWLESPERADLVAAAPDFAAAPDTVTVIADDSPTPVSEVTAVITNRVKPEAEGEFRNWLERIQRTQASFPGYLGATVQPPIAGVADDWVTLLRFDTAENLRNWMDSSACAALTVEAEPLLERADFRVSSTSFRNWLPSDERASDPPLWKVNAIVLLVLFPVVLLTVVFLNPILAPLGVAPTVFIGNVIGVAATGFWLVPWAAGRMSRWLNPDHGDEPRASWLGTVYIVLGYAGLIAVATAIAHRFG